MFFIYFQNIVMKINISKSIATFIAKATKRATTLINYMYEKNTRNILIFQTYK